MTDFERLIDAVKRGDLPDVRAILAAHNPAEFINQRDPSGATALHYAAFGGHRSVVHELVNHGAGINATDSKFGATPGGWAIEYLREMGGFLGIELDDLAHAIRQGDVEWVKRFLHRFPTLRAPVTLRESLSTCLPRNREVRRLWSCSGQLLRWDSLKKVGQPAIVYPHPELSKGGDDPMTCGPRRLVKGHGFEPCRKVRRDRKKRDPEGSDRRIVKSAV